MVLFRRTTSQPQIEIWECTPLVVFHGIDGVVYAANTDVEYVPSGELQGMLTVLTPTPFGWLPEIHIDAWHEPALRLAIPGYQPARGRTIFGHDADGDSFTWFIGNDAVDFLLTNPEGNLGEQVADPDDVDLREER